MPPGIRVLMALAAMAVASAEGSARAAVPAFDHVFVILMENQPFSNIIGNTANAPYINSLASQYGLATNYFAVSHPSLPNYLALTGASTFGITSDCTTCFQAVPNIAVDRIEASGRTWKSYEESMPSACFSGDSGEYAQKHDPLFYYNDVRTVPAECDRIVPYPQLATDLGSAATTPNYAFITPNLCDDMHDSCSPLNNQVKQGDTWLNGQLPTILNSPAYKTQNSVVFIVWDEDDSSGNNQVAALVISKNVPAGFRSVVSYSHYSILKTIETAWGLSSLTTNDSSAAAMSDFFVAPPPIPAAASWSRVGLFALFAASGLVLRMGRANRARRLPGDSALP